MRKRCRQSFAGLTVPRLKTSCCVQTRHSPPRARQAFLWDAPKTADPAWALTVAERVPPWEPELLVRTRVLLVTALLATVLLATVPRRVIVLLQVIARLLLLPLRQGGW